MNGLLGVLRHQILIPLALPIALLLVALALRSGRVLWHRFKQGGFPPIVIHAADDFDSHAFAVQLSEFLSREDPGPAVIIPPGSGEPPPPVPVEQLSGGGGWAAAFVRIVLSREPAFEVFVECPARDAADTLSPRCQAIIRVMRVPGNRVLAADHLHDEHLASVVDAAGCLVIHNIRQEPRVLRHIPRWERWSPDIKGYSAYRRALDCERSGNSDAALREYDHAIRYEPGNFLISIRKAALLEVVGNFKDASEVYRTCNELWPEHIETAYRLSASYANDGDHSAAEMVLRNIQLRLRRRILRKERAKTWLVTHWNVGERRYWRSLSRRHPPIFGTSNRHQILKAVQVADQVRKISRIALSGEIRKARVKGKKGKYEDITVDYLIREMARLTARGASKSPYKSLFHPEQLAQKKSVVEKFRGWRHALMLTFPQSAAKGHDSKWHNTTEDENLVIYPQVLSQLPWQLRSRKRLGWLAHYNAACFYSIALCIDEKFLPAGYSTEEWKRDCARASIRELGHVRRDPFSKLKPDWYRNDPELQPLTRYVKNNRWAKLVGL